MILSRLLPLSLGAGLALTTGARAELGCPWDIGTKKMAMADSGKESSEPVWGGRDKDYEYKDDEYDYDDYEYDPADVKFEKKTFSFHDHALAAGGADWHDHDDHFGGDDNDFKHGDDDKTKHDEEGDKAFAALQDRFLANVTEVKGWADLSYITRAGEVLRLMYADNRSSLLSECEATVSNLGASVETDDASLLGTSKSNFESEERLKHDVKDNYSAGASEDAGLHLQLNLKSCERELHRARLERRHAGGLPAGYAELPAWEKVRALRLLEAAARLSALEGSIAAAGRESLLPADYADLGRCGKWAAAHAAWRALRKLELEAAFEAQLGAGYGSLSEEAQWAELKKLDSARRGAEAEQKLRALVADLEAQYKAENRLAGQGFLDANLSRRGRRNELLIVLKRALQRELENVFTPEEVEQEIEREANYTGGDKEEESKAEKGKGKKGKGGKGKGGKGKGKGGKDNGGKAKTGKGLGIFKGPEGPEENYHESAFNIADAFHKLYHEQFQDPRFVALSNLAWSRLEAAKMGLHAEKSNSAVESDLPMWAHDLLLFSRLVHHKLLSDGELKKGKGKGKQGLGFKTSKGKGKGESKSDSDEVIPESEKQSDSEMLPRGPGRARGKSGDKKQGKGHGKGNTSETKGKARLRQRRRRVRQAVQIPVNSAAADPTDPLLSEPERDAFEAGVKDALASAIGVAEEAVEILKIEVFQPAGEWAGGAVESIKDALFLRRSLQDNKDYNAKDNNANNSQPAQTVNKEPEPANTVTAKDESLNDSSTKRLEVEYRVSFEPDEGPDSVAAGSAALERALSAELDSAWERTFREIDILANSPRRPATRGRASVAGEASVEVEAEGGEYVNVEYNASDQDGDIINGSGGGVPGPLRAKEDLVNTSDAAGSGPTETLLLALLAPLLILNVGILC